MYYHKYYNSSITNNIFFNIDFFTYKRTYDLVNLINTVYINFTYLDIIYNYFINEKLN